MPRKSNTVLSWGNPYTHEEHTRECIPNKAHRDSPWGKAITKWGFPIIDCGWCGSKPARLYRYDGDKHVFCNRSCYNSYHF